MSTTFRTPGRRGTVATAVALCLASLSVAALAWADGEDDTGFADGAGTRFVSFDGSITSPPVVDEAPDGTIVSIATLDQTRKREIPPSLDRLLFTRLSSTGAVVTNEITETPWEFDEAFDVETVGAETWFVAAIENQLQQPERAQPGDEAELLAVLPFDGADDPSGNGLVYNAPLGCLEGDETGSRIVAEPVHPHPAAAEITPGGVVYAVWNDCADGEPWVARYAEAETTRIGNLLPTAAAAIPERGEADELALGPHGDVYVSLGGEFSEAVPSRSYASGLTLVVRLDGDTLARDSGYGNDGAIGAILPGQPIDLTVDGDDRAVAWNEHALDGRGAGRTWDVYRLDPEGATDPAWGTGNGRSAITHELLGGATVWSRGHAIAQADGKVVLVGPSYRQDVRGGAADADWVIVRTTAAGGLDPAWDGDGVRQLGVDGNPQTSDVNWLGEPGLQADGKLLLPYQAYTQQTQTGTTTMTTRVPVPPANVSLGVTRIGRTPAQQQPTPTTPTTPTAAPAAPGSPTQTVAASRQVRTCGSKRAFTIRLRTGRRKAERSPIVSAVIRVNGKRVKVNRRARQTATVNLENLPKGRFTVSIRLTLADGGKVRDDRRYWTCTPKIRSELKPLRTSPPKRR